MFIAVHIWFSVCHCMPSEIVPFQYEELAAEKYTDHVQPFRILFQK